MSLASAVRVEKTDVLKALIVHQHHQHSDLCLITLKFLPGLVRTLVEVRVSLFDYFNSNILELT